MSLTKFIIKFNCWLKIKFAKKDLTLICTWTMKMRSSKLACATVKLYRSLNLITIFSALRTYRRFDNIEKRHNYRLSFSVCYYSKKGSFSVDILALQLSKWCQIISFHHIKSIYSGIKTYVIVFSSISILFFALLAVIFFILLLVVIFVIDKTKNSHIYNHVSNSV